MALAYGATGAGVETLQAQLRGLGYSLDVDGVFGAQTHDAVTHFQQAWHLGVDGAVGDQTLAALYQAVGRGWRTPDPAPWVSAEAVSQAGEPAAPAAGGPSPKPAGKGLSGIVWIGIIAGAAYLLYRSGAFKAFSGVEDDADDDSEE